MDDTGRLRTRAIGVAEANLDAGDDRPPEVVEEVRRVHGLRAPAGRVEDGRARRQLGVGAERLGQRLDQLAQRRLGLRRRRRRRAGDHEQRLRLGLGEPAEVCAGAADQLPSAVATGLRVDRDAGDGQRLEVPAGCLHRHLQLGGELGRRHSTAGLQDEQGGHQSIGTHVTIIAPNVDTG